MPAKARADLVEWSLRETPEQQFEALVPDCDNLDSLIALAPNTPALQDDRPVNEYFFLRIYSGLGKAVEPCPASASR